jgi:hypothetical protein
MEITECDQLVLKKGKGAKEIGETGADIAAKE